jgi:hypothetical protein
VLFAGDPNHRKEKANKESDIAFPFLEEECLTLLNRQSSQWNQRNRLVIYKQETPSKITANSFYHGTNRHQETRACCHCFLYVGHKKNYPDNTQKILKKTGHG